MYILYIVDKKLVNVYRGSIRAMNLKTLISLFCLGLGYEPANCIQSGYLLFIRQSQHASTNSVVVLQVLISIGVGWALDRNIYIYSIEFSDMFFFTLLLGSIIVSCNAFTCQNLYHCKGVNRLASTTISDTTAAEDISKCTVIELKNRLREVGLTVGGRKSELIDRLNEYYLQNPNEEEDQQQSDVEGKHNDEMVLSNDTVEGEEEDLSKLNVATLKDRLRDMGLPVGGRKVELIERLQNAKEEDILKERLRSLGLPVGGRKEELLERLQETSVVDDIVASDYLNNEEVNSADDSESTLLDILDEILVDDDEDDALTEDDYDQLNLDEGVDISSSRETRRAKRKKYWKAQVVYELLKENKYVKAVKKAEEMISSLERMAKEEDDTEYLPGENEYTLLIDAYSKVGTSDAIHKAEAVIDHILELSNDQSNTSGSVKPTAKMFNALISAWASIGTAEAAEKATSILDKMEYLQQFSGSVKPTVHSYSITISAWGKCHSEAAAENAENILNRLFENYDKVLKSDDDQSHYAEMLTPNGIVFNSCIDAWATSGSANSGERAEALLYRMEVLSRLDEYDVRPDTISFNTCIKAWCNSNRPDCALKAEDVLAKLEKHPEYPKRAGGTLKVRPNRLSYNTCINAWAKSQRPESAARAEAILLRMIKCFKSDAFSTITPDAHTFSSVLNTLAKSRNTKNKSNKCRSILMAMIELHENEGSHDTRPNIICFNTVLNACAFSAKADEAERRQALAVSVEIFNIMRQGKYVSPDALSYGNMLKSCANLMPPGEQRNAMASRLFESCSNEGLVGGMALDEIRRCLPPRAFLPLLADLGYDKPIRNRKAHSVELRELPRNWTQNVKRSDMASRQRASFAKPKQQTHERRRDNRRPKEVEKKPVIRRPGLLFEYSSSGKDM